MMSMPGVMTRLSLKPWTILLFAWQLATSAAQLSYPPANISPIIQNGPANRPLRQSYVLRSPGDNIFDRGASTRVSQSGFTMPPAQSILERQRDISNSADRPFDNVNLRLNNRKVVEGLLPKLGFAAVRNLQSFSPLFSGDVSDSKNLQDLLEYAQQMFLQRCSEVPIGTYPHCDRAMIYGDFGRAPDRNEADAFNSLHVDDEHEVYSDAILPAGDVVPTETVLPAHEECFRTVRMRSADGDEITADVPCGYMDLFEYDPEDDVEPSPAGRGKFGVPDGIERFSMPYGIAPSAMPSRDTLIENIVQRSSNARIPPLLKRKRLAKLHTLSTDELELLSAASDTELTYLARATEAEVDGILSAVRNTKDGFIASPTVDQIYDYPVRVQQSSLEDCTAKFDIDVCQHLTLAEATIPQWNTAATHSGACHSTGALQSLPCSGQMQIFSVVRGRLVNLASRVFSRIRSARQRLRRRRELLLRRFGGASTHRSCGQGRILFRNRCADVQPPSVLCTSSQKLFSLNDCNSQLLANVCPEGFELVGNRCQRAFSPLLNCAKPTRLVRGKCMPEEPQQACPSTMFSYDGHCMLKPRGRMLLPRLGSLTCPEGYVPINDLEPTIAVEGNRRACGRLVEAELTCPPGYELSNRRHLVGGKVQHCVPQSDSVQCKEGHYFDKEINSCVKQRHIPLKWLCERGFFDGSRCHTAAEQAVQVCAEGYQPRMKQGSKDVETCVPERHLGILRNEPPVLSCDDARHVLIGGVCFESVEASSLCDGEIDTATGLCTQTLVNLPKLNSRRCRGFQCTDRVGATEKCPEGTEAVKQHQGLCVEIVEGKRFGRKLSTSGHTEGESNERPLAFCPDGSKVHVVEDAGDQEERVLCVLSAPLSIPKECTSNYVCGAGHAKSFCPGKYSAIANQFCVKDD